MDILFAVRGRFFRRGNYRIFQQVVFRIRQVQLAVGNLTVYRISFDAVYNGVRARGLPIP